MSIFLKTKRKKMVVSSSSSNNKPNCDDNLIVATAWIIAALFVLTVFTWIIVAVWSSTVSDRQTALEKRMDSFFEELQKTRHHFGNVITTLREFQIGKFRRIERVIRNESVACGLNGAYGESDPCLY
jgi:hypothetical protein